jgi:hypothetical protein
MADSDRFIQIASAGLPSGQVILYALDATGQVWSLPAGMLAWSRVPSQRQSPPPAAGPAPTPSR